MQPLEPAIITIFGITGDLAQRKLLPSLYRLAQGSLLPDSVRIVGISRRGTTVDDVLTTIRKSVEDEGLTCDQKTLDRLRTMLSIVAMDITKGDDYKRLKQELDAIEDSVGVCLHRIFYLAIPSSLFGSVIERVGQADLSTGCQHGEAESRLLIEKPFGYDQESAEELIEILKDSFHEDQIYRIDHYLAKETVQNILTFRFGNPLFRGVWNNQHISHIMITATESIGIEGRASFYESIGALRDIIQSHLIQVLALVTMDKPAQMTAEAIHEAKEQMMALIMPPTADRLTDDTVRGQYASYRQEAANVSSQTETYAAVKLTIESARWEGVPMYIRTGKALKDKATEIVVVFRDDIEPETENHLTIRIQPNEGIVLNLHIKQPGFDSATEDVQMNFCYDEYFGDASPTAYERVLVDALRGDKTLFATSREVLESWRIVEPILQSWQSDQQPLYIYEDGSWGPEKANVMLEETSHEWSGDIQHVCAVHVSSQKSQQAGNEPTA